MAGIARAWPWFLCCLGFIGIAGLHRLYTGQPVVGVIQFCTMGGFFVWTYLDFKAILSGDFRDVDGKRLSS
jgi:TM2 domain-containing membrane protein YozV